MADNINASGVDDTHDLCERMRRPSSDYNGLEEQAEKCLQARQAVPNTVKTEKWIQITLEINKESREALKGYTLALAAS